MKRRILVLGGGYGGLACIRGLAERLDPGKYGIVLIDANPYHAVKTRFHERAASRLRDPALRFPLKNLAAVSGAGFVLDAVTAVDLEGQKVSGRTGVYPYDRLVIALGAAPADFGIPGVRDHAHPLQNYDQAALCGDAVEDLARSSGRHNVVVCGGGIEGVEVAAQIAATYSPDKIAVTIVERASSLLNASTLNERGKTHARGHLERRGVLLLLGRTVSEVTADEVVLADGSRLPSDLTLWCSGQRRVPVEGFAGSTPLAVSRFLTLAAHPEVTSVGDFAQVEGGDRNANLASAQRAVYQGALAAENIARAEEGRPLRPAFYRPKGEFVALGDSDGAGVLYGATVTGMGAAALKKANEYRYLAILHSGLARPLLHAALFPFRRER